MKTKITLGVVAIALVALLIAGGTSSWFTAAEDVPEVEFTAGTLIIDVDETPEVTMESGAFDNVNPGDEATVCWDIKNNGSKKAEIRIKIKAGWEDESLSNNVVTLTPNSYWVLNGGYYYYTEGPVDANGGEVTFCLDVKFSGPDMNDDYQGKSYTISGTVEAIQSTNDAPSSQWVEDFDEIVGNND